jgi:predicted hydrocarbon binding protein
MTAIDVHRREALAGGHVKGAMVRAHLQFVRDRLGEPAVEQTLATLPPSAAAEIHSVLSSTWCAFETLILLDRAIARVAGQDERKLMRELGRYSAEINLKTVYRAFRRDEIHDFFRRSATLHKQFQDFGICEYEQLGPSQARIRIREAACFSPAYCASEVGYLEQVIAIHGGTDARISESTCQCAYDAVCMFELHWH